MLLSISEFLRSRLRESNSLPKGVNDFVSFFAYLLSDLGKVPYKMSACNTAENDWVSWQIAQGDSYVFIMAEVKLHFRVHRESQRHFENKDRLGEVYVLCQGVHNLQSGL